MEDRRDSEKIKEEVAEVLRSVYDPEIPVNIYELGLVYSIDVDDAGAVHIEMTLTSPNCPEAQTIPIRVQQTALSVRGVSDAKVEIVWDPPWTPDKMSEAAKLELGLT